MQSVLLFRLAPLSLMLLGLAGCASRATMTPEMRAAALLSSSPPPAGRACHVVETPAQLPRAEQLVDVAGLAADIAALGPTGEDGVGYMLISMAYDRFGTNIRRAVIEHNLRPSVADSIQSLVFEHRRTVEESDIDWGVRMRIELTDPLEFATGRQEYCTPRPRDAALAQAIEMPLGTSTRYRGGYRERRIWVRLQINPRGNVTGAWIERGVVSDRSLEYRVYDYVRSLFFEPALEDGRAVSGTISIPLVVRER